MQAATATYGIQTYSRIQNIPPATPASSAGKRFESAVPSSPFETDDFVSISSRGQRASRENETGESQTRESSEPESQKAQSDQQTLSKEELATLTKLQARDTEVRAHEQAHLAAAGQYATSGASFSYSTGPDGKRYATGGEVSIDISKENNPQATVQKMRVVQRAALAPANPSATDRSVASQAAAKEAQALQEIREESSVAATESSSPAAEESSQENTETVSNRRADSSVPPQLSPAPSDFSRKTMNAAYQAMLGLAS